MKRIFLIALLLIACRREPAVIATTDTRSPIEVAYVGAPEMKVFTKADDTAPLQTTFLNGESISVLAKKGDWIEVRTVFGSGWAHASDLTTAAAAKAEEENPTPKFARPPSPVTQPGAHGIVYIEANVNDQGEVTSGKIITNTTGSDTLAEQNLAALKMSKFYPIVRKGLRTPFVYYYRVDY